MVRFYCRVISCALARRGVRRGGAKAAVAAESSACGTGNAVGPLSGNSQILDRVHLFSF